MYKLNSVTTATTDDAHYFELLGTVIAESERGIPKNQCAKSAENKVPNFHTLPTNDNNLVCLLVCVPPDLLPVYCYQ